MYGISKRIFDFCISLIALVLLFPLFIAIALIIKVDSKGPVLFRQKRIGKEGEIFEIYKFRTMILHLPEESIEKHSNIEDCVTRFGRWLRKTNLDELPQLMNILCGEMSFVGPRPALHNQYELIRMREEMGVNKLRPGLTGVAQVKGHDFISNFEKVVFDSYYARNRDFQFDMKVLFWTVKCVLKTEGMRVDFE
ncbi:sugar transferase [Planomicrobium sp. CPCC 101110]|uniref:sugar transferase n=1 Tax=Planomicrobium sp. CPCC 101110 TaxID=2599619 RepID=UPI0011B4E261|nr:sugar transferase [Planomicrobium sp. CPCC 101110]TWT27894.1 sugar transferase [Planomicrobium sp. CPCC 101110]